ncbi:MAG TPA: hypothetical protein VH702_18340, partial [Vicinamibacterales bacterium]
EYGPDEADTTTRSACSGSMATLRQVADLEAGAGRAPRLAGVVALEISIASGDAQGIGSIGMNGELVGVPRSPRNAVAPCAAAVDRGYQCAGLDRDPESFGLEGMAPDPSNVMRVRPRWK